MARACAISLLRKAVIMVYALLSLLGVRAATPGSSDDDQAGNPTTLESWKDYLTDRGITISPEWDADVFANVRGGIKQRAETDGLIRLGLDLDCQKIIKLSIFDNADIHVEGYYPYGTDISDYVGDLAGVNNNYAYNTPPPKRNVGPKGLQDWNS